MKMKQGGGGDRTLESRHVVGMFLGVVVMCGIFFTLGYVMGRTQYDSSVRAAAPAAAQGVVSAPQPVEKSPVPAPTPKWDFAKPAESQPAGARLEPPAKPAEPPASEPAAAKPAPSGNLVVKSPAVPKGGVVLQIAALRSEFDALALADALQRKSFPAYVQTPVTGDLFRVQVGPYNNAKDAEEAKRALQREGFKAIVKR